MLQADEPNDFVLATNETHPVREFVELAFAHVGTTITWEGEGVEEIGYDTSDGQEKIPVVRIDPKYFRPTEVDILIGNPAKAEAALGWKPTTLFRDLVKEMVDADLALVDKGDLTS